MATSSQGSALPVRQLSVPAWVVDADIPMLPVVIPQHVLARFKEELVLSKKGLVCTGSVEEAVDLIMQVKILNSLSNSRVYGISL